MKTTFASKVLLATVSVVAAMSVATAYQATQEQVATPKQKIQKVTIAAKRMSPEEKLIFDLQSTGMHTVVISAKRLTAEQKVAMDEQDRAWQATAKSKTPAKG
jgi:hypothetical protein